MLRCGLTVLFVAVMGVAAADEPGKDAVKEFKMKDLFPAFQKGGSFKTPVLITDRAGVEKWFTTAPGDADRVTANVDFSKQQLIYFNWVGNSGDALEPKVGVAGGKTTVT